MYGCESSDCVEEVLDKNSVVCERISQSINDSNKIRYEHKRKAGVMPPENRGQSFVDPLCPRNTGIDYD